MSAESSGHCGRCNFPADADGECEGCDEPGHTCIACDEEWCQACWDGKAHAESCPPDKRARIIAEPEPSPGCSGKAFLAEVAAEAERNPDLFSKEYFTRVLAEPKAEREPARSGEDLGEERARLGWARANSVARRRGVKLRAAKARIQRLITVLRDTSSWVRGTDDPSRAMAAREQTIIDGAISEAQATMVHLESGRAAGEPRVCPVSLGTCEWGECEHACVIGVDTGLRGPMALAPTAAATATSWWPATVDGVECDECGQPLEYLDQVRPIAWRHAGQCPEPSTPTPPAGEPTTPAKRLRARLDFIKTALEMAKRDRPGDAVEIQIITDSGRIEVLDEHDAGLDAEAFVADLQEVLDQSGRPPGLLAPLTAGQRTELAAALRELATDCRDFQNTDEAERIEAILGALGLDGTNTP